MKVSLAQVALALRSGMSTVEELLPLAVLGGPAATAAATVAGTLIDLGQAALDLAENGAVVATSDDQAVIKDILRQLQAKNDDLAKKIAAS